MQSERMAEEYECTEDEESVTTANVLWFYAKSKVPVCLAITDSFHFLSKLKDADILSEEEALELQGDTRSVPRVVYECLCWIEEKNISIQYFFEFLLQKKFLKKYPDLKPIYSEYKEGKFRNGIHSTADTDKDLMIFAEDKVQICLAITDRFPFLHGLQDLTILSESESLKLQADERPVSRVIYESLSLIEKKDLKLSIVFEYILQKCYLKLYPGLQDMVQETRGEVVAPFNGRQYPTFNIATDLLEFFNHNKMYICEAINDRFPFLHGLHDRKLLSRIQFLRLQADKRSTKEVLYDALCHIQTLNDIENFFAYVFKKFYLQLYPDLHKALQCLNAALTLDICPPSPVTVKDENMDIFDQNSSEPSTVPYEGEASDGLEQDYIEPSGVAVNDEIIEILDEDSSESSPVSYWDETRDAPDQGVIDPSTVIPKEEIIEMPEQDSSELSPVSYDSETKVGEEQESGEPFTGSVDSFPPPMRNGSYDVLPPLVRTCRLQPISYSEPPDFICELVNRGNIQKENSKRHYRRRKAQEIGNIFNLKGRSDLIQGPKSLTVRLEFPKQVFNDHFKVRCGNKTGIFKKADWTGNSAKDLCIYCEGKKFTVTAFEKYGGRASFKNWKKSIHCEKIKMECLFQAGILKRPIRFKT